MTCPWRQARALFAGVRQRLELARGIWTHVREEGADLVTAGLAALRAAAQRHGLEREQGAEAVEERAREHGVEAESIQERLARILERDLREEDIMQEVGTDAIRDRLHQVLGHDKPEPRQKQQHELEEGSERQIELERQRNKEKNLG